MSLRRIRLITSGRHLKQSLSFITNAERTRIPFFSVFWHQLRRVGQGKGISALFSHTRSSISSYFSRFCCQKSRKHTFSHLCLYRKQVTASFWTLASLAFDFARKNMNKLASKTSEIFRGFTEIPEVVSQKKCRPTEIPSNRIPSN